MEKLTALQVASKVIKEHEPDLIKMGIMPNNSNKIEEEKINYRDYEILRGGLVLHWFEPKLTALVNGNGRKEDFLPNMYCGNREFYLIIANFCLKEIVEKCRDWEELGKFLDYNFYRCPDHILFLNFIYFSYKPYFTKSFSEHDFVIVKKFDLPINRKIAQYVKEWVGLKIVSLNLQDISFDASIDLENETPPTLQNHPELIKLNYRANNDKIIKLLHAELNGIFIENIDFNDFERHFKDNGAELKKMQWKRTQPEIIRLFTGISASKGKDGKDMYGLTLCSKGEGYNEIINHFYYLNRKSEVTNYVYKTLTSKKSTETTKDNTQRISIILDKIRNVVS
jgi:hypothetical protein